MMTHKDSIFDARMRTQIEKIVGLAISAAIMSAAAVSSIYVSMIIFLTTGFGWLSTIPALASMALVGFCVMACIKNIRMIEVRVSDLTSEIRSYRELQEAVLGTTGKKFRRDGEALEYGKSYRAVLFEEM